MLRINERMLTVFSKIDKKTPIHQTIEVSFSKNVFSSQTIITNVLVFYGFRQE